MSKLIDLKHPFQIKNIKSINEYLFILKNILRIVSQKGALEKPQGINVPVRWSSYFNKVVVDFGSNKQRDISGVHLDNLSLHYNESSEVFNSINHILNKLNNCNNTEHVFNIFKLKKNENRFLNFLCNKEQIFCTGIYNRCENSIRSGIYSAKKRKSVVIDNSIEFLENLQKEFDFISIQEKYKISLPYNKIYLNFLEKIENLNLVLRKNKDADISILFHKYIHLELVKNKLEIKKYIDILNKKAYIDDDLIFWFLIYHITIVFNHNLLESLNSNKINDIIIYDNISDEQIKIVKSFNINKDKKEKCLNPPLMPVSF